MKLVVRADDVGYSNVCNIGTFETLDKGIVTSMDLMLDVPGTEDALEQGYLVFGSDSGHVFPNGNPYDCSWVMNRECFENYAHLSLKKTKDAVMFLTEQVYGKKPEKV